MFKRILVATDGSDFSRRALTSAIEIAEKFAAEIELLHVAAVSSASSGSTDIDGNYMVNAADMVETGDKVMDLTIANNDTSRVKIIYKTISGKPAAIILRELRRDFDLVVIGTRGLGPLAGAVLGSVAQRVVADSPCPVLVVK